MNKNNILPLLLMILCVFNVQSQEEAIKKTQVKLVSSLWIDYSKYWKMADNFSAWEKELLVFMNDLIASKPEKLRDRIIGIYTRKWEKALDEIYNSDWTQLSGPYVNMFQEKTPNMVESWKWLDKWYELVYITYKQEQDIAKQEQDIAKLKIRNSKLDRVLDMLSRNEKPNTTEDNKEKSSGKKQKVEK